MIDLQDIILPKSDPIIYWVIALLAIPFFSFITTQKFKSKAPHWATFLLGLNTLIAIYLTTQYWNSNFITVRGHWFKLGETQITYSFLIDRLTLAMSVIVNFISLLVHLFSQEYMRKDKAKPRYFAFLGLFTFSMMGIVLFNDLLFIFIFWELVGLSSYLLIGFWFEKKSASLAANKAFIMNRLGDLGFITGLMILYTQFQSFDLEAIKSLMIYSEIEDGNWVAHFVNNGQEVTNTLDGRWLSAAGIALFCGAVGKSAQFPLQVWLPDAMEGPTPVSALIHAATMVAAGVYMLARVFVILDAQALEVVAIVGAITAFMAAIAALSQFDIKKVLAYSTISQLGYMVMAMGIGAYTSGLFHLVTHAFFKAGLFLSAGIIIHQLHKLESKEIKFNTQDMRVMGGLRKQMPKTFFCFLICALALAGLPGFSGFLSKDAILLDLAVWADIKGGGFYIPEVLAFATVLFTGFYTIRMIMLVFFGNFRLPIIMQKDELSGQLKEGNWVMLVPVAILALLSLSPVFGFTLNAEHTWFVEAMPTPIYLVPISYAAKSLVDVTPETFEALHGLVNAVSIGLALIGIVIAYLAYKPNAKLEQSFVEKREPRGLFGQVSFYHWYQDALYRKAILKFVMLKAQALAWFDRKVIDGIVDGLAKFQVIFAHLIKWFDRYFVDGLVHLTVFTSGRIGQLTRSIQSGNVQAYILMSFVFLILLMLYLVF
ncbi:NADH-quinone oxidoreductase subunit L [Roseivirga sp. 4D4]|uniref:NADH-quinone oxidoreductase subunit L n=1 Tax=Roseivirga sp. 4D4 TaxID=1889784 RepID=UPI0009F23B2B|nr:NADH-quinone oxidoreductase subunit L [Roseivirga sp. 4D4]